MSVLGGAFIYLQLLSALTIRFERRSYLLGDVTFIVCIQEFAMEVITYLHMVCVDAG